MSVCEAFYTNGYEMNQILMKTKEMVKGGDMCPIFTAERGMPSFFVLLY